METPETETTTETLDEEGGVSVRRAADAEVFELVPDELADNDCNDEVELQPDIDCEDPPASSSVEQALRIGERDAEGRWLVAIESRLTTVPLTDADRLELADRMVATEAQLEAIREEKKQSAAMFRERERDVEAVLSEVASTYRAGQREVRIKSAVWVRGENSAEVYRVDTGELVERRPPTQAELQEWRAARQGSLPFDDPRVAEAPLEEEEKGRCARLLEQLLDRPLGDLPAPPPTVRLGSWDAEHVSWEGGEVLVGGAMSAEQLAAALDALDEARLRDLYRTLHGADPDDEVGTAPSRDDVAAIVLTGLLPAVLRLGMRPWAQGLAGAPDRLVLGRSNASQLLDVGSPEALSWELDATNDAAYRWATYVGVEVVGGEKAMPLDDPDELKVWLFEALVPWFGELAITLEGVASGTKTKLTNLVRHAGAGKTMSEAKGYVDCAADGSPCQIATLPAVDAWALTRELDELDATYDVRPVGPFIEAPMQRLDVEDMAGLDLQLFAACERAFDVAQAASAPPQPVEAFLDWEGVGPSETITTLSELNLAVTLVTRSKLKAKLQGLVGKPLTDDGRTLELIAIAALMPHCHDLEVPTWPASLSWGGWSTRALRAHLGSTTIPGLVELHQELALGSVEKGTEKPELVDRLVEELIGRLAEFMARELG